MTSTLHVGDHVNVHDYGAGYDGLTGTLDVKDTENYWYVKMDPNNREAGTCYFSETNLELVFQPTVSPTPVDAW